MTRWWLSLLYWRLMDALCWVRGHRGCGWYCLRCARRLTGPVTP